MIYLSKNELSKLSRVVSHALRHKPWLYELELDKEGWVPVEILLISLRQEKPHWIGLSEEDLIEMINFSEKQRHEISDGKIRALYGHSLPETLLKEIAEPPETLYHGTSPVSTEAIKDEGLKPMGRQYVHMSIDIETAKQVGHRKSAHPVILKIDSHRAFQSGLKFYRGNNCVWLSNFIPSEFIQFPTI
jgi:putative RNA 2'-phosphotransferase